MARGWPNVLKAGCVAYLDTFAGLVPVKVIKVTSTPDRLLARPRVEAEYEITKTVGAYKQGEVGIMPSDRVVPKGAVKTTPMGQFRILPYDTEVTA